MYLLGYFYMAIVLLAGLVKGYCGKKVSGGTDYLSHGVWITALRMLLCTALGLIVVLTAGDAAQLALSGKDLLICLLSAFCMALFNVSWLFSIKNQSYMFLSIFLMLGSIVTTICSAFAFGETVSIAQWIGMAVLLGSVFVMSGYDLKTKGKMTLQGLVTLIVCALASCFTDFSQKLYVHESGQSIAVFQFYTYLFALILLALFGAASLKAEKQTLAVLKPYIRKMALLITIMSVCLYINSTFKSMAAAILPAALLYPVMQAVSLVLSALMAHFILKEKMNKTSAVGIALALIGMMIVS